MLYVIIHLLQAHAILLLQIKGIKFVISIVKFLQIIQRKKADD